MTDYSTAATEYASNWWQFDTIMWHELARTYDFALASVAPPTPRTLTTAAELDALPTRAVVLDKQQDDLALRGHQPGSTRPVLDGIREQGLRRHEAGRLMSPKYDIGAGVTWPETLELGDRDPVAYPRDGLKGSSFPMHVNIAVAEAGTVCSVDLDTEAAARLYDWLGRSLAFSHALTDAVADPGYVDAKAGL